MLYLMALRFGDFASANLTHWTFLVALLLGMQATARQMGNRQAGALAALAIASSSVVGTSTACAGIDAALAAAIWWGFHGWLRWLEQRHSAWWLPASICCGFAMGLKYTGVVAALMAFSLLAAAGERRFRLWMGVAAVMSVWIFPWLAQNAAVFGNPFYPFLNAWFPNPYLLPSSEAAWLENVRHFGGAAFNASYPWEATVRGVSTMGFTGPFFLLAPLALGCLAMRQGRLLLLGGVLAAVPWVLGNPTTRFAIPTLPFIALAVCLVVLSLPGGRLLAPMLSAAVLLHAVLCFPPFIGFWNKQWVIARKTIPWRGALRLEQPRDFWRRSLPSYAALEYAEAHLPASARILALDEQYQFFTTRLLASPYGSEQSSGAIEILERAANPGTWPVLRCRAPAPAVPVSAVRLVHRREHPTSPWTVFEAGIPGAAARPAWSARVNRWDTAALHDGDPVTAWSSKQAPAEGIWLEGRWRVPLRVPGVEWLTSPEHAGIVRVVRLVEGARAEVASAISCEEVPAPGFQRRSVQEVRRRGWTHVLATAPSPWLDQALRDPRAWGIRVVFDNGRARLVEFL